MQCIQPKANPNQIEFKVGYLNHFLNELFGPPSEEKLLRDAGVPIPDGFSPTKKSYTLHYSGKMEAETSSIGVLWKLGQVYVAKAVQQQGFKCNKNGGLTLCVRKCGGWLATWQRATTVAGWPEDAAGA